MGKFIDLKNKKIGKWMVIERIYVKDKKTWWRCICDCKNEKIVNASHLLGGKSTKCKNCHGKQAVKKRPLKHGHCSNNISKEYRIWSGMKTRCLNEKHDHYYLYGGRGIKISKRWLEFKNFFEDMGKCPENMTLERKNVNGNYSKKNCKWAYKNEQSRNRRNNVYLKAHGKKLIITDWARLYNIPETSFRRMIKKLGWPLINPPKETK